MYLLSLAPIASLNFLCGHPISALTCLAIGLTLQLASRWLPDDDDEDDAEDA